ncbi:glycine zipper 2TM domain-containing protein [Ideonella sp. 4Y16]|uniref:Glycine zipper 2TM domain-containing protein n=1 Tax=Ideonella alba TaxID=2824118 RepID=A0A941BGD4_9BURK|nr:glycine zipper 2TM domain-containing protein [Ideonella alba]MBQ0930408.1 glycine zipper 2TM domain-containing protein [Ideonella alba]MBQ0946237.1 glycine zipper 2TM domain-containing protein [Ideonella alba]
MNPSRLLPLSLLTLALGGCVVTSPDRVPVYQTQRLQSVQEATVVAVRPVTIDGHQSGGGSAIGAVVGGVAGSQIGGYRDGFVGSIVGFVAGAMLGNAIERDATRSNGIELTLQMRNGDKRMIVQGQGAEVFQPGDAVTVVSDGYRARVSKAAGGNAQAAPAAPTLPPPVLSARPAVPPPATGASAPVYTPR